MGTDLYYVCIMYYSNTGHTCHNNLIYIYIHLDHSTVGKTSTKVL